MQIGPLGLFFIAVVDSSIVPLPIPGTTDLLLLLFVSHGGNPWLFAPAAVAGSILGGYTTWQLGRKGGKAALNRWVSPRLLGRLDCWIESHPILAVFLPAVLPPPIPLSPFLLAAGALGIERRRFLTTFSTARLLRYGLISVCGVVYGRGIVRLWSGTLDKWSVPLLWAFLCAMVAGMVYGIFKLRRPGKSAMNEDIGFGRQKRPASPDGAASRIGS